jgi:predicted NUDIX family NTP pyrophosphohydrolase
LSKRNKEKDIIILGSKNSEGFTQRDDVSCGAIIFRQFNLRKSNQSNKEYLTLYFKNDEGDYHVIPKGHQKENESKEVCALAEILEETDISDLFLFSEVNYSFQMKPTKYNHDVTFKIPTIVYKKLHLYLVKTMEVKEGISPEGRKLVWQSYEKTLEKIYKEYKPALIKFENIVKGHSDM